MARGTAHFEVLNSGSDGDVAFWAGRQVEVFRREDGQWKLVHRHADLVPPAEG